MLENGRYNLTGKRRQSMTETGNLETYQLAASRKVG